MEPKDKEVIDLDFDPDILANYLEKLNLETPIPDLSGTLNEDEINSLTQNFEEGCSIKQFSEKENSEIEPCWNEYNKHNGIPLNKIKNEENISIPDNSKLGQLNDGMPITVSIKKEIDNEDSKISQVEPSLDNVKFKYDVLLDKGWKSTLNVSSNFKTDQSWEENSLCNILQDDINSKISIKKETLEIKNEIVSDSSTDEDENDLLVFTRGPDRNKKRYNKRKQLDKPNRLNRSTDAFKLDQQRLLFLSSGHIVSNNSTNVIPQLPTQHDITNFDSINTNNKSVGSPGESGYETSQSSGLYSPSPSNGPYSPSSPIVDNLQASNIFETSDDEEAFIDFVLELGKTLESTNIGNNDCNIPIFDDNKHDYIEKLTNYLKESNDNHEEQYDQLTPQNGETLTVEQVSSEIAPFSASVLPVLRSRTKTISYELK